MHVIIKNVHDKIGNGAGNSGGQEQIGGCEIAAKRPRVQTGVEEENSNHGQNPTRR